MRNTNGVIVESVSKGTPADKAGIHVGDTIVSINGNKVKDIIDYLFYNDKERLELLVVRKDRRFPIVIERDINEDVGITLKHFKIKTCKNRCIFCFVSQLPKGLRRSLYIKDEDYRMSFLYGNYITLTNITACDKKRIIEQRLSPLYISVHSTNKELRNKILGNPKAPDILKEIKFFKEHKIKMHCQIVLCPGYNDGEELERTINDLYKFYPYVASIAVVPVGLTAHRKNKDILRSFEKDDATKAIGIIEQYQKKFKKRHGDNIVYASDELYIKAGSDIPHLKEYGDLPQIENGVGMVALFQSQAKSILSKKQNIDPEKAKMQLITVTGISFYPILKNFADKLNKRLNINLKVLAVENDFFGRSVTVTGLLTGRDIIKTILTKIDDSKDKKNGTILLIPDTVLRAGDNLLLDDVSIEAIEEAIGIKTVVIEATPMGLINWLGGKDED